jgi:hypothetical protein
MSLLKLLAAGRSLMGTREAVSPYRMRTPNLLPKFGSPKNPFAQKPKAEPTVRELPAQPAIASAAQPAQVKAEPAKLETAPLFEATPSAPAVPVKAVETRTVMAQPVQPAPPAQPVLPVQPAKAEPIPAQPAIAPSVVPARQPVPWGEWAKKLNPLKYLPTPKPGARQVSRTRPARAPVQAELSLEKVKVVRNDLSDTDLEIVAPQATGLPGTAGPMLRNMTRTQPTNWNRMTSSVVGAVQTMIR